MKKLLVFIILFLVAATLSAVISFVSKPPIEKRGSQVVQQQSWNSVAPGLSTLDDVTKNLGQGSGINPSTGAVEIPVTGKVAAKHEIYFSGQTVSLIKRKLYDPEEKSFKKLAGNINSEPLVFLGPDAQMNIYLYVYPESGVAYLANLRADSVYEIWYFNPTDPDEVERLNFFSGYLRQKNPVTPAP